MEWLSVLGWLALGIFTVGAVATVFLQVPPVPSRLVEIRPVFELARIRAGETVFDLGAGDGRILQIARDQWGTRVAGWELNPLVWVMGKIRLGGGSDLRLANLWQAPVHEADVVFVFLMQGLMGRVEREIWSRMKPGARLVSNSFPMTEVAPAEVRDGVFMYQRP